MKIPMFIMMLTFLSGSAWAACTSFFTPINVVLLTVKSPTGGAADADAESLWNDMLVAPQDSPQGPGKAVTTPGNELKFICNQRPDGDICVITLSGRGPQSSRWVQIDGSAKKAKFRVEGDESVFFTDKFRASMLEQSADGHLRVQSQPGLFEISYSESGF